MVAITVLLPGGKVIKVETAKSALVREFKKKIEETTEIPPKLQR
jgi:ADP-ribose pyrophosphatase YjhB (NUDIX family)